MSFESVLKLVLAAVLGGVVGLERQMRDKPAGLRTNMLICIGATQFMTISTEVARIFGGEPSRIAAQIISGIGFLGAGAVLHSHGFVMGLTTAATIWVVAGIGMALGAGMYWTAVLVTILTVLTLYLVAMPERRFQNKVRSRFSVLVDDFDQGLATVNRILEEQDVSPANLSFKKENEKLRVTFEIVASREAKQEIIAIFAREHRISEVETTAGATDAMTHEVDNRENES